jgi:hypothetical protein
MSEVQVGGWEGSTSTANTFTVLGAAWRDIATGSASRDEDDQYSKKHENNASQRQSRAKKTVRNRRREQTQNGGRRYGIGDGV